MRKLQLLSVLFLGSLLLASCGTGRELPSGQTKYERGDLVSADSLFQMEKNADSTTAITTNSTLVLPEITTPPEQLTNKEKRKQKRAEKKAKRQRKKDKRKKGRRDFVLEKKRIKQNGKTDREREKQDGKTERKIVKQNGRTDRTKTRKESGGLFKFRSLGWIMWILLLTFVILIAAFGRKIYNKYFKDETTTNTNREDS